MNKAGYMVIAFLALLSSIPAVYAGFWLWNECGSSYAMPVLPILCAVVMAWAMYKMEMCVINETLAILESDYVPSETN